MVLRFLRLLDVLLVGTLAGVVLTHALEWPGKTRLSAGQWLAVQHDLYGGYAVFGGVAEVVGLLLSVGLGLWLMRRHMPGAPLYVLAALAIAAMLAIFAFAIQPINLAIAAAGSAPPTGWQQLRDRWSLYHTMSFFLALIAFVALLVDVGGVRRGATRE